MFIPIKITNIKPIKQMGFFGNILGLTADIVVTPLAITKDVLTLGGELTGEDPATPEKLEDIVEGIQKLIDPD